MSTSDIAIAIKQMRGFGDSDAEILAYLQKHLGYEGTALPRTEGVIDSANELDTKQVITREELDFEENAAKRGITTEAQKTQTPAADLWVLEHQEKEKNWLSDRLEGISKK